MVKIEFSSNYALAAGAGPALDGSIAGLAKPVDLKAFRMTHAGSLNNYQLVGKITLATIAVGFTFIKAPHNEADPSLNPQYFSIYGCCPACRPTTPLGSIQGQPRRCGNCGGEGSNFGRTMLLTSGDEIMESIILTALVEAGSQPLAAALEANLVTSMFFTALEAYEHHMLRLREPGKYFV